MPMTSELASFAGRVAAMVTVAVSWSPEDSSWSLNPSAYAGPSLPWSPVGSARSTRVAGDAGTVEEGVEAVGPDRADVGGGDDAGWVVLVVVAGRPGAVVAGAAWPGRAARSRRAAGDCGLAGPVT